eukprot:m.237248 g.237248  ORF g.237248 m.237248 type:complete len:515 (+) comp16055_c1_seq3:155-1699(+)
MGRFLQSLVAAVVVFVGVRGDPVRLIVDTDAGFDVDDVGAIGIANALQDLGECEIIAVGHTNGFIKGIGAVSSLMNFYNRNNVSLGAYKGVWARDPNAGKGTADKYVSDLVANYPSPVKNYTQVMTAVQTYRKALVASPDYSVHIASIGITTNMRDLVLSPPDEFSPLNGSELVALKVKEIVWMDMMYNFGCAQAASSDWLGPDTGCHGSAQAAVMNWPPSVKQIFNSLGGDVLHGGWLNGCAGYGSPFRQAFEDWGVGGVGRSSWDPITVMMAVRGVEGIYCKEQDVGGFMKVAESGEETWNPGTGHNQSRAAYASADSQALISFKLNELLCKPPGPWSNTSWVQAQGANCYGPRGDNPAHGATDLEHPPSASAGVMSLSACKQKCLDLPGCTGITTTSAPNGLVSCYRKSDLVLGKCDADTAFTTWVRKDWYPATGYNCYYNHGATELDGKDGCGTMSVRDCQVKCKQLSNCTAVVWRGEDHSGVGACYRKANINLAKCDHDTVFDTYLAAL